MNASICKPKTNRAETVYSPQGHVSIFIIRSSYTTLKLKDSRITVSTLMPMTATGPVTERFWRNSGIHECAASDQWLQVDGGGAALLKLVAGCRLNIGTGLKRGTMSQSQNYKTSHRASAAVKCHSHPATTDGKEIFTARQKELSASAGEASKVSACPNILRKRHLFIYS